MNNLAQRITRLGGRGQGVLFFRDAAFHLGLAFFNESNAERRLDLAASQKLLSDVRSDADAVCKDCDIKGEKYFEQL